MTTNMAKSQKTIVEGDSHVDRISSLPADIKECILNYMPTFDAARTCVLSSRWRYAWANHPPLVLDHDFFYEIHWCRYSDQLLIDYPNIVNTILHLHIGLIRKFVIDVPAALDSMPHVNIDTWLSSLCGRGLKVLKIINRSSNPYKLPCSVFLSSDLIELDLYHCIIRSQGFSEIQTLKLHRVTFESCVILTTPLLTFLGLHRCSGIINFDISAPKLERLILSDNDGLNLKPFLLCTDIRSAFLSISKATTYLEGRERVGLVKLLAAWPMISSLNVNGFCLKYLATGTGSIPCKLNQLKLINLIILDLRLDSVLMPWILCMLRNSPFLLTLKVLFGVNDLNDKIDESRIASDFQMNQLRNIILKSFTATSNELVLAKILLQCAPVLEKMNVEENTELHAEERLRILKKLLYIERPHPKPSIVFEPNMWCACPWIRDTTGIMHL